MRRLAPATYRPTIGRLLRLRQRKARTRLVRTRQVFAIFC